MYCFVVNEIKIPANFLGILYIAEVAVLSLLMLQCSWIIDLPFLEDIMEFLYDLYDTAGEAVTTPTSTPLPEINFAN